MSVTGASRKLSTTRYCGTPASCMMIWMVVAAVVIRPLPEAEEAAAPGDDAGGAEEA